MSESPQRAPKLACQIQPVKAQCYPRGRGPHQDGLVAGSHQAFREPEDHRVENKEHYYPQCPEYRRNREAQEMEQAHLKKGSDLRSERFMHFLDGYRDLAGESVQSCFSGVPFAPEHIRRAVMACSVAVSSGA